MAKGTVDNGRAFEYAFIENLNDEIIKIRPTEIIENSSYYTAKASWDSLSPRMSENLKNASKAAVPSILELEPMILSNPKEKLLLKIQSDDKGERGDVRDIVINLSETNWEVGLSMKHNHFAVKHSRLSMQIDFAKKWFGNTCSENYWNQIKPIFNNLKKLRKDKSEWSEMRSKEDDVYVPLLKAFMHELMFQYNNDKGIPGKLVEYLLGRYDFYKVVGLDDKKITEIQVFNIHGTLNKYKNKDKNTFKIGIARLPERIICLDFKPDSKNTLELFLDNGWQFSFRIHSASKDVEPSLKFDIQIVGAPTTIETINCRWR